jgi:hypothetical protein
MFMVIQINTITQIVTIINTHSLTMGKVLIVNTIKTYTEQEIIVPFTQNSGVDQGVWMRRNTRRL